MLLELKPTPLGALIKGKGRGLIYMADGACTTLHGASFIVEWIERARDDTERRKTTLL